MNEIAKLLTVFLCSFIGGASPTPDGLYSCDGNPVGLCDLQNREILAAQYSAILYVGHGIFLALSRNPVDRFEYGNDRHLFNRDGSELTVTPPQGSDLMQVFWLGKEADRNRDLLFSALPGDAIFRFRSGQKYGLCNAKGKVILPAVYEFIGKAADGKAFVTASERATSGDDGFYIFDCVNCKLTKTKLPYTHCIEAQRFYFSEGLAAFGDGARHNVIEGYIDSTGSFAFKENFSKAGPFMKGVASVTRVGDQSRVPKQVVIDRNGKVVSPSNLEVQEYYGDFAVASKVGEQPPKFGVVNREFQFVIQPKYEILTPVPKYDSSSLDSPGDWFARCPSFYIAVEKEGAQQKLISVKNEILLKLPENYTFNHLESSGKLRCYVPAGHRGKIVHLNMNGEPIDTIDTNENEQSISYYQIAPERLRKTVILDRGKFDAEYWKNGHSSPISKREMFGRFLNDFNVIGMSREELVRNMGYEMAADKKIAHPDEYCFPLDFQCCVDRIPQVIIHLTDNKVDFWCFSRGGKRMTPITYNAILAEPTNDVGMTDDQMFQVKPK